MSRTTVRKFVAAGAFPERANTLRSKSILDPYIPYLQQRLEQGPAHASQLWRDVREQGFSGSYKVIARWVKAQGWQLRKGRFSQARRMREPFMQIATTGITPPQESEQPEQAKARPQATLEEPLESPRHLVWLWLRDPAQLSQLEELLLRFIRQEPTVELAYTLAQHFIQMMHAHQTDERDGWMRTCASSGIADLETFAVGLQKEFSAIRAAFTLPYSTGPVEGQVNRLKLIKRSLYSRGSFALLRRRVLYSDSQHESCG